MNDIIGLSVLMKKLLAFILAWICYGIGNLFCQISHIKIKRNGKKTYWFDGSEETFRSKIGFGYQIDIKFGCLGL